MTVKSLFILIVKIIGIYLLVNALSIVFSFLTTMPYLMDDEATFTGIVISILAILAILSFYGLIVYLFLFQTEQVLEKLALTKGLEDQKVGFLVHQDNLLRIIFYVTGILILVDSIPHLCKQGFAYFEERYVHEFVTQNPSTKYIVYHFVKVAIGFWVIKENKEIVSWIERKSRS